MKSLLDTDFYKFTMGQLAFHQFNKDEVQYEFRNRTKGINLSTLKEEIKNELSKFYGLKITQEEYDYLSKVHSGILKKDYLDFLKKDLNLNASQLKIDENKEELIIEAKGSWKDVIFWEIIVLSTVNQIYYKHRTKGDDTSVLEIGKNKLNEKIKLLLEHPDIKILEFGTRRRYSKDWQEYVFKTLKKETSQVIGTSNVLLAMKSNTDPSGTMAHELFQFFQGKYGFEKSQELSLKHWILEYGNKLDIALTDIYGTNAFLSVLDKDLTNSYSGYRHDSGCPYHWTDKMVNHFKKMNDNSVKTLVFSDGLNIEDCISIKKHVSFTSDKIKAVFGIGTNLTNDLRDNPLSLVMKMVKSCGENVVKISDEPEKAIGDKRVIYLIKKYFNILGE